MIEKYNKKPIGFLILAIFLVSLIISLCFIDLEGIVNKIGVRNGYILAFIVSFFGGFSAGGSISFIGLLIILVAGGMNPVYLGLISGVSLIIGDIIMFYAGSKGRELVKGRWNQKIDKVAGIFKKKKWLRKTIPIIAYIYMGFAPLPNDILLLFLATIRYSTRKMSVIIVLGDMTFALVITILASKGILI